jgi:hypothetical protein
MSEQHPDKKAYDTMLGRMKAALEQSETLHDLTHYIDHAREKAVELEELSREEAERIGDYLRRDIEDAAHYLNETGKELADWFQFDLTQIEDNFFSLFSNMVDNTRESLQQFAQQAQEATVWYTGETMGAGTLRCQQCGEILHFAQTACIPPCPNCQATTFDKQWEE